MLGKAMKEHTMRSDTRMSSIAATTIHHGSQSIAQGTDKFRKRHAGSKAEANYSKKE